jgi:hypothetical protein
MDEQGGESFARAGRIGDGLAFDRQIVGLHGASCSLLSHEMEEWKPMLEAGHYDSGI